MEGKTQNPRGKKGKTPISIGGSRGAIVKGLRRARCVTLLGRRVPSHPIRRRSARSSILHPISSAYSVLRAASSSAWERGARRHFRRDRRVQDLSSKPSSSLEANSSTFPPPLVASWLLKCRRFCVCVDSNCSAIPNSGGVSGISVVVRGKAALDGLRSYDLLKIVLFVLARAVFDSSSPSSSSNWLARAGGRNGENLVRP